MVVEWYGHHRGTCRQASSVRWTRASSESDHESDLGEPPPQNEGRGLPHVVSGAYRVVNLSRGVVVEEIVDVELALETKPLHGEVPAHPQIELVEPSGVQGAGGHQLHVHRPRVSRDRAIQSGH